MKKSLLYISILCTIILATGCASNSKIPEPRERDETFIADINSFSLDTVHLYTQRKAGKPKVNDLTLSFSPRNNYVYVSTKIGINFVRIGFSYNERVSLKEAQQTYIDAYTSKSIKNEKPNKKNAYSTGGATVEWGTTGYSRLANATYMTNVCFLEANKPYFRIYFIASQADGEEQIYSPAFSIYISPAQWNKILELCNQETLVAQTDEIIAQANEFDVDSNFEYSDEVEQVEETEEIEIF